MKKLLNKAKCIFAEHTLLIMYSCMFTALINGQYVDSGNVFLHYSILYFVCFVFTYTLCHWLFSIRFKDIDQVKFDLRISERFKKAAYWPLGLFVMIFAFIFLHYLYLHKIPLLTAYLSTDYYEIVDIRKDITRDAATFIRYGSSFMIKAIIPFTILLLFIKKKKNLYWALLFIGAFYATSLMQKSFIITILSPVLIYSLLKRKWFYAVKHLAIILASLYTILYVSNPDLRNVDIPENILEQRKAMSKVSEYERNKTFVHAIYKRVMLTPGKMVSDWYKHIPKNKPFLNGCGYRFVAPLKGCEFHNYAQDLYPLIYPKYAAIGIQGNVNVASFMYDYANFNWKGLILSGIILGILFCLLELLFRGQLILKLCLLTFYVLMLSSSALTTLLLSGGLGLMVLFYIVFKRLLDES